MRRLFVTLACFACLGLGSCQSAGEQAAQRAAEAELNGARMRGIGCMFVALLALGFALGTSAESAVRTGKGKEERDLAQKALAAARKQLSDDRSSAERDKHATESAFERRAALEARAVQAFDQVRASEQQNEA